MCAVRSGEVVKPFPFVEFGLEIDVTFVAEKLIELLLIRSVRSFDFAVELRCAAFDVGVPDPEIFDMSMELGLELMTVVSSNLANAEWELFDDVIHEVDGVCLRVLLVDLESPNSACIIYRCILEPADLFSGFLSEYQ